MILVFLGVNIVFNIFDYIKKDVFFQVCTMVIVGLRIFLLISWYIGLTILQGIGFKLVCSGKRPNFTF